MELNDILKKYAQFLTKNINNIKDIKTSNSKIRDYYLGQFKELGLNIEYFRILKKSKNILDVKSFLELIPEEERFTYEENEELIQKYIDVSKNMTQSKTDKIAQAKSFSKEINQRDPMAKRVLDYYKICYMAKIELQKNLKNKTVEDVLKQYSYIEDYFGTKE